MIPKWCKEKLLVCYMDTNSLVIQIKSVDLYKDIAKDIDNQKGQILLIMKKKISQKCYWTNEGQNEQKNIKICYS